MRRGKNNTGLKKRGSGINEGTVTVRFRMWMGFRTWRVSHERGHLLQVKG